MKTKKRRVRKYVYILKVRYLGQPLDDTPPDDVYCFSTIHTLIRFADYNYIQDNESTLNFKYVKRFKDDNHYLEYKKEEIVRNLYNI